MGSMYLWLQQSSDLGEMDDRLFSLEQPRGFRGEQNRDEFDGSLEESI